MAANVRYRSTYYNTTGTSTLNRIDVLDTEAVGDIVNFSSTRPMDEFEGLTQDLKPGIYPSSFKFGMYIRETPAILTGTSMGVNSDFITDIAESAEGRFLVAHYIDDVLDFIGPIIYDQCSYEDFGEPYLLNITAVDGLNRWQTTDYVSEVGQLRYYSRTSWITSYDDSTLSYDGPLVGMGTMTVVEHTVDKILSVGSLFRVITTFVHREIYSNTSPGSGWVDQGEGLWAKVVTGTNATITDNGPISYKYTLDIDDERHRTISELFYRAMVETKMAGEYPDPDVMYDISIPWYENSTGDLDADMATQTRHHEEPLLGGTWWDGMLHFCRQYFMRIYYSKGRYHFENISQRDDTTFNRFIYKSDGTSAGAVETASLDLDFGALDIEPSVGGIYKFLAPLRSVEASVTLDQGDLLAGVTWKDGEYGTRYLGRIKRGSGVQQMRVVIGSTNTSTFDPDTLSLYPQPFINLICLHKVSVAYSVRITNVNTATTYYLEPITFGVLTKGEWTATVSEITPDGDYFGGPDRRYSPNTYGHTVDRQYSIIAEDLPGSADDMFEIHVSFRGIVEFSNQVGATLWTTIHLGKFWNVCNATKNSLKFYSTIDLDNQIESEVQSSLVYVCENSVDNSIKVKTELQWADTTQHNKSIEIYNGTEWQQSSGWSIGGTGDPVAILELLVNEIMSLRAVPRKLYSGAFVSSVPNAENRFQRGTDFYLPLSCTRDSDVDTFQGEFLQIAKTTPPAIDVIGSPIAGEDLVGLVGADPPPDLDTTLYFETNEAITAGATLTEVDIVNTLEVYVPNGETVTIVNSTTGESENVTLTQEILPSDTVMHFESNVMAYSYPDGSPIVIQDGDVTIESGGSKYRYDNRLYNGSTHTVPVAALDLVALDGLSNQHLNNKVWVFRNGQKLIGVDFDTIGLVGGIYWWYDSGTNQISVHTDFEYVDEWIHIDIDLNR